MPSNNWSKRLRKTDCILPGNVSRRSNLYPKLKPIEESLLKHKAKGISPPLALSQGMSFALFDKGKLLTLLIEIFKLILLNMNNNLQRRDSLFDLGQTAAS